MIEDLEKNDWAQATNVVQSTHIYPKTHIYSANKASEEGIYGEIRAQREALGSQ